MSEAFKSSTNQTIDLLADSTCLTVPDMSSQTSLMELPIELHLLISSHLTYPDALSLKHTNRYFYGIVYTSENLFIEWLIDRRTLHLDCPHDKGCELGSDMRFCRGSVSLLMKRRREHGDCETRKGGRGCLVFGTKVCTYGKTTGSLILIRNWLKDRNLVVWILSAFFAGLALAIGLSLVIA